MINFRQKYIVQDLMPEAIDHLKKEGIRPNFIEESQADSVSKMSSRSMVLEEFIQNEQGHYQIKIRDAKLYSWTKKMISEVFRMRILDINEKTRVITAETDHLGLALEIIEILGLKYNLSIVQK